MKILFIVFNDNESTKIISLAPLYLEAYCRNKIDFILDIEMVEMFNPKLNNLNFYDIICVSNCFFQYPEFKNFILLLKKQCNLIIGGGPAMTFFDEKLLQEKIFDGICYGAGEKPFLELLIAYSKSKEKAIQLLNNHQSWKTYDTINKNIIYTELSDEEFNSVPFLNYSLYKIKLPVTSLLLQQGCKGCCCFCSIKNFHKIIKNKKLDVILKELDYQANNVSKYFYLVDDDPFIDWEFYKPILEHMKNNKYKFFAQNIQWFSLDEQKIELLSQIYLKKEPISLNPDAACKRVYKEIVHKRGDFEKIKEIIQILKSYGFIVIIKCLIGFPGETEKEIESYYKLKNEWNCDGIYFDQAYPLKNTELRKICDEKNYFYEDIYKNIYRVDTPEWSDDWIKEQINKLMGK